MRDDLYNNLEIVKGNTTYTTSDNTAITGDTIDLQGSRGFAFIVRSLGLASATGTFAIEVQEGDESDASDMAAVADSDLFGTEAALAFAATDDNKQGLIGYRGNKRYVRMVITPSSNDDAATFAVIGVQTGHRKAPITQALA